jgi:hypothetical protein
MVSQQRRVQALGQAASMIKRRHREVLLMLMQRRMRVVEQKVV